MVVFPAPFGPSSPTISPCCRSHRDVVHDAAAAVHLDQSLGGESTPPGHDVLTDGDRDIVAGRGWLLARLSHGGGEFSAAGDDVVPDGVGESQRRVGVDQPFGREADDPFSAQTGKEGVGQIFAHLVEAQATGFAIGVAARGAERSQVVVAVRHRDAVEDGGTAIVGCAEQCVDGERGGAVSVREALDERGDGVGGGGVAHRR